MLNNLFPKTYLRTPAYRVGYGNAVDSISDIEEAPVDVYTVSGVIIRHNEKLNEVISELPAGIYIAGGKKIFVR